MRGESQEWARKARTQTTAALDGSRRWGWARSPSSSRGLDWRSRQRSIPGVRWFRGHSPRASATPSPFPTPPAAGPVTALGASVADDPATHRVVLFGGVGSTNKTWLWDGRHWTSATPRSSPPNPRQGPRRPTTLRPALSCSLGAVVPFWARWPHQFNDTWAWNGTTWRRLDSGGAHWAVRR